MKKQTFLCATLFALLGSSLMFSCTDETLSTVEKASTKSSSPTSTFSTEAIDSMMHYYTLAVAKAAQSEEFRITLKKMALQQFDGDYDILASTLHKQTLPSSQTTIQDLIASCYDQLSNGYKGMNGNVLIDVLVTALPNLQLSIPVNCEEWNAETYTPHAIHLPLKMKESTTTITAYDAMGMGLTVSTMQDPPVPYIIVSESERVDRDGKLIKTISGVWKSDTSNLSYATPSYLKINYAGINKLQIEWENVEGNHGYKVFRNDPTSASGGFELIYTAEQNENQIIDTALTTGVYYTYTVRAIGADGTLSGYSQTGSWYAAERTIGEKTTVGSIRFSSKSALNKHEFWLRGRPEIVMKVYAGNGQSEAQLIRSVCSPEPEPSRDEIANGWYGCNIEVANWDPNTKNNCWLFSWSERDNSALEEISVNINTTCKINEVWSIGAGLGLKFKIPQGGDMGSYEIDFWDPKGKAVDLNTRFLFRMDI